MGAWACYYSDFPVVSIRDGAVRGRHNDVEGVRALAVAGFRVALSGGCGPDHDRLALTELGADRAHAVGQYRVVLPAVSRCRSPEHWTHDYSGRLPLVGLEAVTVGPNG